jgi:hypothetical protein
MALSADIGPSVRAYVAAQRIDARVEARWLAWAEPDAAALLGLGQKLGLGGNHLADVITWLEEIAARERTAPASLLGAPEVQGILAAPLGRADKVKRLKALLRRRRYPRLAALEAALEAEVGALGFRLGRAVRVRFPPGLEGGEITVEISADRPGALRKAVERLHAAVDEGGFERLFALLDEAT